MVVLSQRVVLKVRKVSSKRVSSQLQPVRFCEGSVWYKCYALRPQQRIDYTERAG